MKNILILFIALLSFVAVSAQTQGHSIVIDESSLSPVQTDALSGVAIDKIGKDTSKRPCARIKLHVNRMTRTEIEQLDVRPVGGSVVKMKQVVNYDGNGRKIYVPQQSAEAYKNAYGWRGYSDAIVGYEFED